jgi:hypothetical protein
MKKNIMKKDMLNEVYRIQELIGIKKNILNENRTINFLKDLGQSFITKSTKVVANTSNLVDVGAIRIERELLKNLEDV